MKLAPFWISLLFLSLAGCAKVSSNPAADVSSAQSCSPTVQIGGKEICYEARGDYAVTEGDIVLGKISELQAKSAKRDAFATSDISRLGWPEGVVAYSYDPGLSAHGRAAMDEAIAHYQAVSRIRFVQRTNEANYVQIIQSTYSDCRSSIGMIGGEQTLWFGDGCTTPNAIHELGHVIGLYHEFSRPDRDQYINILLENIIPGTEANFATVTYQTLPIGDYDFTSIMHYGAFAFSKDGISPTMTKKDGSTDGIGGATALSAGDLAAIGVLYPQSGEQTGYSFGRLGSSLSSQAFLNGSSPSTLQWNLYTAARNSGIFSSPQLMADRPVTADFDKDGVADLTVYRPSTGEWFINRTVYGPFTTTFGGDPSDMPVPADYDGDGRDDLSIYRVATAEWMIRGSKIGYVKAKFSQPGTDMPIPADYDGDGITDVAVFRPSTGQWLISRSKLGFLIKQFGWGGVDVPIPADYDGDGIADLAVYRPTTAQWFILRSKLGGVIYQFGGPGFDIPVPADYDGDGITDIGVFRGPTGEWLIWESTGVGVVKKFGAVGGDLPVPGKFVGGKKSVFAIYRPQTARWFIEGLIEGDGIVFGKSGYFY